MKSNQLTVIISFTVCAIVAGCSLITQDTHEAQEISEDAPLPDFLLGSWTTEHVYQQDGSERPVGFDVTFINYDTIEVVVFENGEPTDMTVSKYNFIDSNIIFVDNKRITGGETWYLERSGQKLIVLLELNDGKKGITLVLVRKK